MRFEASCPKCGSKYSVKKNLVGKKLKCRCGEVFQLSTSSRDADQNLPLVQVPAGFWDERFDEIKEDQPVIERQVVRQKKAPEAESEANFEMTFTMDPVSGTSTYYLISSAIGMVVLFLTGFAFITLPEFMIGHYKLTATPIVIYSALAFLYSLRVYYTNQMTISIKNTGISIRHIKKLPWPSKDQDVPFDDIEDVQIESDAVPSNWYLRKAEHSHKTYDSKRRPTTYVHVYELNCKLKSRRWTTRLATITDRSAAKTMRLHLKRMLQAKRGLAKS